MFILFKYASRVLAWRTKIRDGVGTLYGSTGELFTSMPF